MADGNKRRVMVSSVVEGFGDYREASRRGIIAAGGEPVLVNEDFPSLHVSPRNACLDAVDSVDVLVSIVGERGGWTTPSGKLVVEEEYERAVKRKIPVLVFLQEAARDAEAARFAGALSNYVDGTFLRTFSTTAELEREVTRSLSPLVQRRISGGMVRSLRRVELKDAGASAEAPSLRFQMVPEREEEVFDPVTLGSRGFLDAIYRLAHASDVGLFSYESSKSPQMHRDALVVTQSGHRGERLNARVQLRLFENGELVIDATVQPEADQGNRAEMLHMFVVAVEDVERVLETCLRFSGALFDEFDRFKRHNRFLYNVWLNDLGYRRLERDPKPHSGGYTMRMNGRDPLVAFAEPRIIARSDLTSPPTEIERVMTLLVRQAEH